MSIAVALIFIMIEITYYKTLQEVSNKTEKQISNLFSPINLIMMRQVFKSICL